MFRKPILHESEVFAPGTARQILGGKDFDRGLHGLLLVDEPLSRCFLVQSKDCCTQNDKVLPREVQQLVDQMKQKFMDQDQKQKVSTLHFQKKCSQLMPLLDEFKKEDRSKPLTFCVWDDLLQKLFIPVKQFLVA